MIGSLEKQLLHPVECLDLIRLGHDRDGGYVVPAVAVDRATVLLSLGLSDEWSFDRSFLARNPGATLIGVDHSVGSVSLAWRWFRSAFKILSYSLVGNVAKLQKNKDAARNAASYFSFFRAPNCHVKKMVASSSGGGKITLPELLKFAGAEHPLSVFLKVDIEGAEYEIIGDIVENAGQINCITAEFHGLDRNASILNDAMRRLQKDFYLVHVHGNNFESFRFEGYPRAIEVTLLNKGLVQGVPPPSRESYPLAGLDAPNFPDRPEAPLSFN